MSSSRYNWKKIVPIAVLVIGLILFFSLGWYKYFSFSALQKNHEVLEAWTKNNEVFSAFIFIIIYIVAVSFSFPGATLLTLTAGFLFGILLGTIYVVIGATLGACIIFLAARYAFADALNKRAGKWLKKLEVGFQQNAFSYLLFLRFLPLFPFWLINIIPGLLNVPLKTFFWATLLGIIPGSAVYVSVGNGLSSVFAKGETPNFGIIFEPQIIIPILLLAILSIIPIVYKKIKARRLAREQHEKIEK